MSNIGIATLAGGCFWCVEAVFELVEGVDKVISGYTGGTVSNPTYEEVCDETTGHAEAIQIHFDIDKIDYVTLLEIFFAYHDPTTLNRQGADIGTRYRSEIFFHDEDQEAAATSLISTLESQKIFSDLIVTKISPATIFYTAEKYHQSFFKENPYQPYCQFVIAPKVTKLREKHSALLKNIHH